MAFVVVYDACVPYPAPLRDFLIRLARTGLVQAKWSDEILDECFRAIGRERPELSAEALARTRRLMTEAIPDCMVSGHASLTGGLTLPDPDDRHVLAAAVRAGAQTIVTFNLRDLPSTVLDSFGIEARHPDDFVLAVGALHAAQVAQPIDELVGADRAVACLPRFLADEARGVDVLAASKHAAEEEDLLLGTQPGRRSWRCGRRRRGSAVDPSELFSRLGKPCLQVRPCAVELAQLALEPLHARCDRVALQGRRGHARVGGVACWQGRSGIVPPSQVQASLQAACRPRS